MINSVPTHAARRQLLRLRQRRRTAPSRPSPGPYLGLAPVQVGKERLKSRTGRRSRGGWTGVRHRRCGPERQPDGWRRQGGSCGTRSSPSRTSRYPGTSRRADAVQQVPLLPSRLQRVTQHPAMQHSSSRLRGVPGTAAASTWTFSGLTATFGTCFGRPFETAAPFRHERWLESRPPPPSTARTSSWLPASGDWAR